MEPSTATLCNGKRRRVISTPAHGTAKRLKTVQDRDDVLPCGPRISVLPDRLQHPITLKELMELLHYAALGKSSGVKQPSWCRLRRQRNVKGVNVVVLEGLTQSLFYKHYVTLHHLRTTYTTRLTFTPPPNNLASGIFSSEVPEFHRPTEKRQTKLESALMSHPVITRFGTKRKGLTAYVLSQEEMIRKHYPVKGVAGCEGFVCTDCDDSVTDSSPLYALDCEMCLTVKGYELTRVSVVDGEGRCVLDELVKPETRILNYLTQFSGVTEAMLRPVTTTLRNVQAKLRMLLPKDAVLVGHSLNSDLTALKMIHRHVIDTALLYRKEFGQKFKLKVLAETVLKQIQTEEKTGHDPTEDALAALELAQYFIQTGPLQVVRSFLGQLWGCTVVEEESECEPVPKHGNRFADILQILGRSVAFLGKRSDVAVHLGSQQWHRSDKEVLTAFRRHTKTPFLSVLQLSSFSNQMETCLLPQQELQHQRVCADLRAMCVVFAGPLPAGFSERDVKRLFRCCGDVRKVKMLKTTVRAHAQVEYESLEGAVLALDTLNGLRVQGETVKVQRPVNESTLEFDLTLDALMSHALNVGRLYAAKLNPGIAESVRASSRVNGHVWEVQRSGAGDGSSPAKANGVCSDSSKTSKLCEETLTETFSRFGTVDRISLGSQPGKRARHACIQFDSSAGKRAALGSSEELFKEDYVICPSLTPLHIPSWAALTGGLTSVDADSEAAAANDGSHTHTCSQDHKTELKLRKLDRRLGRLFRSLPTGTLSVVVLLGHTSYQSQLPGLCLLEVKQQHDAIV